MHLSSSSIFVSAKVGVLIQRNQGSQDEKQQAKNSICFFKDFQRQAQSLILLSININPLSNVLRQIIQSNCYRGTRLWKKLHFESIYEKLIFVRLYNHFRYLYNQGVEFSSKVVNIDEDTKVKLQIWDTAGQQSFRSIIKTFYRNVSAVFLVYNIASLTSFLELEFWHSQALENCSPDIIFVLLGAQKDRQDERQVTNEMAEEFMNKKNISFMFQTSAKINQNIDISFQQAAKQIFLKKISEHIQKSATLNNSKKKQSKKCCG